MLPSSRLSAFTLFCVLVLPALSPAGEAAKTTYDDHVTPILREKCFSCHNPDRDRGGLVLTAYSDLMEGGGSGEVITPGDPDASRLYLLVTHQEQPHMPPKSDKLPAGNLEILRKWIAGGALENAGSKARVVAKPKLSLSVSTPSAGRPEGPPPMPENLIYHGVVRTERPGTTLSVATSPWAPLIALGGQKQVLLYHVETLELLGVLPFPEGLPCVLEFSRNGSLLLAGGGHGARAGRVVVWNVKTGERVFEVGDELDVVLAADLSSDQSRIALGGPGKVVRVYSTADGKLIGEMRKHTDWILALEFSPDGVLLATGDRAGGLRVWEAHTQREYLALDGHDQAITDLSWRADSNVLASASEDGTVRLWEMERGRQVKRWGAHGGGVLSVEYTHDGRLVTCGRDQRVKTWKPDGGGLRTFEAFSDIATAVTFSHDGSRVVGGDFNGNVRVWNAEDGKRLGTLLINPPTLMELTEAARGELEVRSGEHAVAARSLTEAEDKVAELEAGLEVAREAASRARGKLTEAEAVLEEARARLEQLEDAAEQVSEAGNRQEP